MPKVKEILLGNMEIIFHWFLRMFPVTICSNIGFCMGRLLGPKHRQATQQLRENISRLRPDINSSEQIEAMIKRAWGNYGRVMAEFSVLRRIWKSDRTDVEGLEHLTQAQTLNRPIIFLFLHLGNWEVIGPKLHELAGGRMAQIYQVLDNRFKMRIAENVRRPYAHNLITTGPSAGKKIYNKLSEGYNLNMAVDEFVNNELNSPSFGRPLSLEGNLTLAVRFSKLTNAVLCPVYATRTKGARFLLHILSPVVFDFTDFDKTKLRAAVEQLDGLIDPIIRQHFDQWYYSAALNFTKK